MSREIFRGLYNAGMTSQRKKRRRTERRPTNQQFTEQRLTEQRLTEQRNAPSKNLDRMTTLEIGRLINREDLKVAMAQGRAISATASSSATIVQRTQHC